MTLFRYEGNGWARKYTTLGFLVAIQALLAMAIQPRAKFLQSITTSILFVCLGAAVALLQIQCVISARQRTTPKHAPSHAAAVGGSGSPEVPYNSSASVVAAVFLFLTIYAANVARARRPQLTVSAMQYSIFTIVASVYAPKFPTMSVGQDFVKRLLEVFLTGFGVATGVSLFVFPITSRMVVSRQTAGLLGLLSTSLKAHGKYMASVPKYAPRSSKDPMPVGLDTRDATRIQGQMNAPQSHPTDDTQAALSAEATELKALISKIGTLFSQINLEVGFAKKEMAYGKLSPENLSEIMELLHHTLHPILGLSTFIDIMQSVKARKPETRTMVDSEETIEAVRRLESEEWDEVMSISRDDFIKLKDKLSAGLLHISYVLEFAKKPKSTPKDIENADPAPTPGDKSFAAHLKKAVDEFHVHREQVIRRWCDHKGIKLPSAFWDEPSKHYTLKDKTLFEENARQSINQQQLYLILYVEYLTWSIGTSILRMVQYADSKVEDGTMRNKRIIFPGWRRLRKLVEQAFYRVDSHEGIYEGENAGISIYLGDSLKTRKDPEHLPPTGAFQKATDSFRAVPKFLASDESGFGFRAAVATLSIGVIGYIRQTQGFFLTQRVFWAMIMVAISMSPHAGQGIFGFLTRVAGSAVAMVAGIAIWYIGGQNTAGILVVFYLFLCGGILFLVKKPTLAIASMISMVTAVLIIGYELQERKIGLKAATSNGQPFYVDYILAPYRLATVIAGIAVSFAWTYFPYPVTTRSTLRKDLGATLFLLANYYSCVHTTVEMKLHNGAREDLMDKTAPMTKLYKARHHVFTKVFLLLNKLREHSSFVKFEPTFGGKFPKQTYDDLIQSMQNVFHYVGMISYSCNTFVNTSEGEESGWLRDFRHFASELNITSHDLTSTLALLSASMRNSQPLPPYLSIPKPYYLARRMGAADPELLSVLHVAEPCYAAFAVLEIASSLITEEMARMVSRVRELVGEVDFSFHVVSTNSDFSSIGSILVDDHQPGKGKRD